MKHVFIFFIRLYQKLISPLKPSCCRFAPTCSAYAIHALYNRGFLVAFCGRVRKIPELKERCFACDRHGFDKAKTNKGTCTYTCHMGLTECVAPIIKKGTIIGYLMLGQTVATENIGQIHKAISRFPLEAERMQLCEELKKLPHFSQKKLQAIANVAQMCTSYLWLMELITMRGNPTAFAIEEYIAAHLAEELSVELLCKEFGISKTSLYLLSQEHFGTGITLYICDKRMEKAMQLLEKKSMPVSDVAHTVQVNCLMPSVVSVGSLVTLPSSHL